MTAQRFHHLETCVQSIGCLEYCNSRWDAIHKNNQALRDKNSPSVDTLALACEGSCEAHVSHGEKCDGIVCDRNGQAEISHTSREADLDRLHNLNSHSDPDLTKSQHIIEHKKWVRIPLRRLMYNQLQTNVQI